MFWPLSYLVALFVLGLMEAANHEINVLEVPEIFFIFRIYDAE